MSSEFMISFAGALCAAFLVAIAFVVTKGWHGAFSMDSDTGIQRSHDTPTPRIGGASLLFGLLVGLVFLEGEAQKLLGLVLACALPAFVSGFVEDITKTVSPKKRLLAALVSGVLFLGFANVLTPLAGALLPPGTPAWMEAVVFALGGLGIVVGLAGTTNAVNIIDGFHGLAAGNILIMSATIAGLAAIEGDMALVGAIAVFAGATLGFGLVNFPGGFLFLGDGGAYLAGFVLGAFAVLLAARTDVSAFVSILVMAYPVYETLFSMVRKSRREGWSPMQPDRVHLHKLVERRFGRFIAYGLEKPALKNPITGALMWPFSMVAACLAIMAQGTNIGGVIGLLIFALFYTRVYRVVSLQRRSFMQGYAQRRGWNEGERYMRARKEKKRECS